MAAVALKQLSSSRVNRDHFGDCADQLNGKKVAPISKDIMRSSGQAFMESVLANKDDEAIFAKNAVLKSSVTKAEPVKLEKAQWRPMIEKALYGKWKKAHDELQKLDRGAKGREIEFIPYLRTQGFSMPTDPTFAKVAEQVALQKQSTMKSWNPTSPSKPLQAFLELIERRAELVSMEKATYQSYTQYSGSRQ